MTPYWLLFLFPALFALASTPTYRDTSRVRLNTAWVGALLALTLMIGLRFRVGGDWYSYLEHIERASEMTMATILSKAEPAYWMTAYWAVQSGTGIVGLNLVTGLCFSLGLVYFCRSLPRPWLALATAVPYMVIVVSMGYSRQAAALGLVMLALVALGRQSVIWFIIWVILGATFHKSAILLLPIGALTATRNRYLTGALILIAGVFGYQTLLENEVDRLISNYVDAQYQSSGALIRLGMNVFPASIFLIFRKRFHLAPAEYRVWRLISLIAIGLFVAFFVTSASTALDRVALYCIPLQLYVFAHLPDVIGRFGKRNMMYVFLPLVFYALVLFVWLNYANNASLWLPYLTIL